MARDVEGELAGAGAHEEAADADVVAEVEELVEVEEVFADVVLADVDLEALAVLLELREAGLALDADGHDAAGDGGLDVLAARGLRVVRCSPRARSSGTVVVKAKVLGYFAS